MKKILTVRGGTTGGWVRSLEWSVHWRGNYNEDDRQAFLEGLFDVLALVEPTTFARLIKRHHESMQRLAK